MHLVHDHDVSNNVYRTMLQHKVVIASSLRLASYRQSLVWISVTSGETKITPHERQVDMNET